MEVHHHSHTSRKKWTHYLWEFLMLFLAVVAGFIAENQREHFIEHKREKQYLKQLLQDLKNDSLFFSNAVNANLANQQRMDSLIRLLKEYEDKQPANEHYYLARLITSTGVQPQYSNRTFEQLKNSGGLRLIRNMRVLDSLSLYYESLKDLDIRVEHRLQRLHNLFLANEELFSGWEMTAIADSDFDKIKISAPLLTSDRNVISRYVLRLGYFKAADKGIIERIKEFHLPNVTRLITLLEKVYRIK